MRCLAVYSSKSVIPHSSSSSSTGVHESELRPREYVYALTILRHCPNVSILFVLEVEAVLFYLSPRPWATITVEVCLRRAGTTRAALVDMSCILW